MKHTNPEAIARVALRILGGQGKAGQRPLLWDGQAAERIVQHLLEVL